MRERVQVLVIGAGVSGLTVAACLADAGVRVKIRAETLSQTTTSCSAGASWGPYMVTDERVLPWVESTRVALDKLADDPATGVTRARGLEVSKRAIPVPAWARPLPEFRPARADEMPSDFVTGWWYQAPLVEMPTYLGYLNSRLSDSGVSIETGTLHTFDDAFSEAPVVVNCAGIGARTLVPDDELEPVRGQLVVVENPGIDWFFAEHDERPDPTYFLPHGRHVVLGGSAEHGRSDIGVDDGISLAIQRRCVEIEPRLAKAKVVGHRVGLRPTRPRVRLERVVMPQGHLVHNYGHGGGGVTLSWGCAAEVTALVREVC